MTTRTPRTRRNDNVVASTIPAKIVADVGNLNVRIMNSAGNFFADTHALVRLGTAPSPFYERDKSVIGIKRGRDYHYYRIGAEAMLEPGHEKHRGMVRYNEDYWEVLHLYLIANLYGEKVPRAKTHLTSLAPVDDIFSRSGQPTEQAQKIVALLKGRHSVIHCGKPFDIEIASVSLLAEGVTAWARTILDDSGKPDKACVPFNSECILAEIGSFTTITIPTAVGGKIRKEETRTLRDAGVMEPLQSMGDEVLRYLNVHHPSLRVSQLSIPALTRIMASGMYIHAGESFDMTEIRNRAMVPIVNVLEREIDRYGNVDAHGNLKTLVLSGGGGGAVFRVLWDMWHGKYVNIAAAGMAPDDLWLANLHGAALLS